MEPTTAEIARDLRQLEARIERERTELLEEVRRGFVDLRNAIDAQSSERITRDVYMADQRRFESELSQLRREVMSVRKLLISSFLAVIAAGVTMMMFV
jgi:thermostable 8-oxoguanine DNA glycosylase